MSAYNNKSIFGYRKIGNKYEWVSGGDHLRSTIDLYTDTNSEQCTLYLLNLSKRENKLISHLIVGTNDDRFTNDIGPEVCEFIEKLCAEDKQSAMIIENINQYSSEEVLGMIDNQMLL